MTASRIHLNTAGAGLPAPGVLAAMREYLACEAELGPYEAEERYHPQLTEGVYHAIGRLLGAPPDEIALFGAATDAWCRVVCNLRLTPDSRIWVTPYEYAGNLIALAELCRRRGCTLEVVPTLPGGDVDLEWMRDRLDDRLALVSVVHVPSGVGTLLPVTEIGEILAGSPAVYVVDACQTVGQIPIDVSAIGCHLLTGAGRKFLRGPRGSGFAYIARGIWDLIDPPCHDVHVAQADATGNIRVTATGADRFETAERSGAVVLGLLAAADYALARAPKPQPDVLAALTGAVRAGPGIQLLAPGSRQAGIVSFVHDRLSPEQIRACLAAAGISAWVGAGSHTPLHLAAMGIERFVRTSVHYYNDHSDIERLAQVLRRMLAN